MELTDLINLLWCSIEIGKGSSVFFNELDNIMAKRIHRIKDEDFQTLISCVTNDNIQPEFSNKILNIVLKVIDEKKDAF